MQVFFFSVSCDFLSVSVCLSVFFLVLTLHRVSKKVSLTHKNVLIVKKGILYLDVQDNQTNTVLGHWYRTKEFLRVNRYVFFSFFPMFLFSHTHSDDVCDRVYISIFSLSIPISLFSHTTYVPMSFEFSRKI